MATQRLPRELSEIKDSSLVRIAPSGGTSVVRERDLPVGSEERGNTVAPAIPLS